MVVINVKTLTGRLVPLYVEDGDTIDIAEVVAEYDFNRKGKQDDKIASILDNVRRRTAFRSEEPSLRTGQLSPKLTCAAGDSNLRLDECSEHESVDDGPCRIPPASEQSSCTPSGASTPTRLRSFRPRWPLWKSRSSSSLNSPNHKEVPAEDGSSVSGTPTHGLDRSPSFSTTSSAIGSPAQWGNIHVRNEPQSSKLRSSSSPQEQCELSARMQERMQAFEGVRSSRQSVGAKHHPGRFPGTEIGKVVIVCWRTLRDRRHEVSFAFSARPLGVEFEDGRAPLTVKDTAGQARRLGLSPGMVVCQIDGQDVWRLTHNDVYKLLEEKCRRLPLSGGSRTSRTPQSARSGTPR